MEKQNTITGYTNFFSIPIYSVPVSYTHLDVYKRQVIDPLFLEDLQKEFNAIKQIQVKRTKDKKLDEFQNRCV